MWAFLLSATLCLGSPFVTIIVVVAVVVVVPVTVAVVAVVGVVGRLSRRWSDGGSLGSSGSGDRSSGGVAICCVGDWCYKHGGPYCDCRRLSV